jgi:hypothetical protein
MKDDAASLLLLIRIADHLAFCLDWHCGTCGAGKLRRALARLLDCTPSDLGPFPSSATERLALMLSQIKEIKDEGVAEALILLVSRSLGYDRTSTILGASPAADHYQKMWQAHLEVDKKLSSHGQRRNMQLRRDLSR